RAASKVPLTLSAFYVMRHALPDRPAARRFLTGLFVAVSVVALLSVLQVGLCPPSGSVDTGPVRLLFRKCARARGFFSIYMTLAGVLTQVLVATLPRLARAGRERAWMAPLWALDVVAPGLAYGRAAWLGLAVGPVAGGGRPRPRGGPPALPAAPGRRGARRPRSRRVDRDLGGVLRRVGADARARPQGGRGRARARSGPDGGNRRLPRRRPLRVQLRRHRGAPRRRRPDGAAVHRPGPRINR